MKESPKTTVQGDPPAQIMSIRAPRASPPPVVHPPSRTSFFSGGKILMLITVISSFVALAMALWSLHKTSDVTAKLTKLNSTVVDLMVKEKTGQVVGGKPKPRTTAAAIRERLDQRRLNFDVPKVDLQLLASESMNDTLLAEKTHEEHLRDYDANTKKTHSKLLTNKFKMDSVANEHSQRLNSLKDRTQVMAPSYYKKGPDPLQMVQGPLSAMKKGTEAVMKGTFNAKQNTEAMISQTETMRQEMEIMRRKSEEARRGVEAKNRETEVMKRGMETASRETEYLIREREAGKKKTEALKQKNENIRLKRDNDKSSNPKGGAPKTADQEMGMFGTTPMIFKSSQLPNKPIIPQTLNAVSHSYGGVDLEDLEKDLLLLDGGSR